MIRVWCLIKCWKSWVVYFSSKVYGFRCSAVGGFRCQRIRIVLIVVLVLVLGTVLSNISSVFEDDDEYEDE